jgi:hypothetical protein
MIDIRKVNKLKNKVQLNNEKIKAEKDYKKREILLLKNKILQIEIQIERLK